MFAKYKYGDVKGCNKSRIISRTNYINTGLLNIGWLKLLKYHLIDHKQLLTRIHNSQVLLLKLKGTNDWTVKKKEKCLLKINVQILLLIIIYIKAIMN